MVSRENSRAGGAQPQALPPTAGLLLGGKHGLTAGTS